MVGNIKERNRRSGWRRERQRDREKTVKVPVVRHACLSVESSGGCLFDYNIFKTVYVWELYNVKQRKRVRERERQRQTDKQTDGQTDRQKNRQTDRPTDRPK